METKPLDCSRIPMAEALRVMMPHKTGKTVALSLMDAVVAAHGYGVVESRNTLQETINARFLDRLNKDGNPLADIIQEAQNA